MGRKAVAIAIPRVGFQPAAPERSTDCGFWLLQLRQSVDARKRTMMMDAYTLELMNVHARNELARARGRRDLSWLLKRAR